MKLAWVERALTPEDAAALRAAALLRATVADRGTARLLVPSAPGADDCLRALAAVGTVPWSDVELFHAEEFVGLAAEHPALCRSRLFQRLIRPARVGRYHFFDGAADPEGARRRIAEDLAASPVDVAVIPLGPRGRLSFHDAPADVQSEVPCLLMQLTLPCRQEQVATGAFARTAEVPDRAIAVSLRQVLKAEHVLVIVPAGTEPDLVRRSLEATPSPMVPASILQAHPNTTVFLDREAGCLLKRQT